MIPDEKIALFNKINNYKKVGIILVITTLNWIVAFRFFSIIYPVHPPPSVSDSCERQSQDLCRRGLRHVLNVET